MLKIIIYTLCLVVLINKVSCDRTKDKIYENVHGHMCFRKLNATHQTGCSASTKSGSVGVLHLIDRKEDIDFITNNPPAPPYAPILRPEFFTRENVIKLRDSGFVSAIVLINDTRGMESFSTESKCPNEFYHYSEQPVCDAKRETTWNPWGSGLLQENFDIPIIFLEDKDEYEKVVNCSQKFNSKLEGQESRSLCSIEINSFMAAAANSEVCIRRSKFNGFIRNIRFCDPLSGRNVYGTLFPREIVSPENNRSIDKDEKIILISARLDTTAMFDGIYPGAMDSLASIATLISTAHFLRKIIANDIYESNKLNVLFMLFNGESYDYIGSQRLVYDLKKNAFPSPSSYTRPINFENIHMMIDLGAIDTFDKLSIYHRSSASGVALKLQDSINFYINQLNLNVSINPEETNNIPPVSAQMFLRENMSFPVVVVAAKSPENRFYHSVYDDANNLNYTYQNSSGDFDELDLVRGNTLFAESSVQIKIRNIATALGLGVYDMLVDDPKKYSQSMIASSRLVDEVIYCYLISTKCKLFHAAFDQHDDMRSYAPPLQRYISVNSPLSIETIGWTYRVLGLVLSEKVENPKENCTILPQYWLPGSLSKGECRLTTQNFSLALSPAFEEDENYNFSSNYYSTWTESTWNDLSARIFLQPSPSHEYFTLTIGIIVFILSFIMVYVINSKAEVLFGDAVIAEHVSLPAQC